MVSRRPTMFVCNTWKLIEDNKWQLKSKTTWDGVEWLKDSQCTNNDGSSTCAGIATFTCSSKETSEVVDGETVVCDGYMLTSVLFDRHHKISQQYKLDTAMKSN